MSTNFCDTIQSLLSNITYKQGWLVKLEDERWYIQVKYDGSGSYGAEPWSGRKWLISRHMTVSEIVYTAFKAILAAEEHETRENFKYCGVEICGPHFSVDALVKLVIAGQLSHDVRENAM